VHGEFATLVATGTKKEFLPVCRTEVEWGVSASVGTRGQKRRLFCLILICLDSGTRVELTAYMHDVLYVPSMKNNLLSLGQLLEKDYTMTM